MGSNLYGEDRVEYYYYSASSQGPQMRYVGRDSNVTVYVSIAVYITNCQDSYTEISLRVHEVTGLKDFWGDEVKRSQSTISRIFGC